MHIVGITSSLRKASCNTGLLRAAEKHFLSAGHSFDLFVPGNLPLFNQDIESEPGAGVEDWRARALKADAFVFATCEYNFSISAALKNAIDWASRGPKGNLFNDKPAGVIGAAGGAGSLRAQQHFRDIAVFLNLHIMNTPFITVPIFTPPAQFDMATGDLINPDTDKNLAAYTVALAAWADRLKK